MPVSRLRLTLAAWFGAAFLTGALALDVAFYAYFHGEADRQLTSDVRAAADGLAKEVAREQGESHASVGAAASDALIEWPATPIAFVVFDSSQDSVAARGSARLVHAIVAGAAGVRSDSLWNLPWRHDHAIRLATAHVEQAGGFTVAAGGSDHVVTHYDEVLAGWLFFSTPAVTLLALLVGYLLARRSLRPVDEMAAAMGAMAPEALDRLPVRRPPDELDRLATQFNQLLDRLEKARAQTQTFLAQAAHQLRTPLTIVRGESALGLERPRSPEEYRASLERISRAAEQMSSRVEDLFLLAQAEAGERPALDDDVELDGLALECTDLMRGRARTAGHTLELVHVEGVTARGNERLLREALLEMIENALRHAEGTQPIRVSAFRQDGTARLEVWSPGPAVVSTTAAGQTDRSDVGSRGLGLSILRWIAAVHGGDFSHTPVDGGNRFGLAWRAG